MAVHGLGHTLVIANPVAHSGKGAQATQLVRRFFESFSNATTSFDLEMTRSMNDAVEIAAHAGGMDTVIALGGDGIIHEVVNGLMAIDERDRPTLGIIPMGTGNDFARSIHESFNNPEASLREILNGTVHTIDLGLVSSDLFPEGPVSGSKGTFFMETLSFGMDAAIAIDTTRRRAAGTNTEGSALFMTSTLKVALAGAAGYPCHVSIDDEELDLHSVMFAVQNGPTYGGGFRICPTASPFDGLLDICYNTYRPNLPHLLALLVLARFGKHTRSRAVRFRQAQTITLDFGDAMPPCQVDGEELKGSRFEVRAVPQALNVIFPN